MDEIDIWRSAALIVRQYGEDADFHACLRIDKMIEHGDLQGESVWKRIRAAISWLQGKAAADQCEQ